MGNLNNDNMRKLLITALVLIGLLSTATARQGRRGGDGQPRRPIERIHAAKMAYITDKLNLSADQAAQFVPVYKEYEKEIMEVRKAFRQKYKSQNQDEWDEVTAQRYIDDNLDYQSKVIEIKRKYNDRFLKVINAKQLADLNEAEREFKQVLQKRLKEYRNNNSWKNN